MSETSGGASSREEMALELARRLLAPRGRRRLRRQVDPSSAPPDFDLFVGQLPPDLPADVPIPPGARVIGSSIGGIPMFPTRVVLDVDLSPEDAVAFFRERLFDAGWTDPAEDPNFPRGVAPPTERDAAGGVLFKSAEGPALQVSAIVTPNSTCDVELGIAVDQRACHMMWDSRKRSSSQDPSQVFQRLPTPPDSRLVETSLSGSSRGESHVTETLDTPLSAIQVLDHYAAQLRASGWRERDRYTFTCLTATWELEDERGDACSAFLSVSPEPGSDHHVLVEVRIRTPGQGTIATTRAR